MVSSDFVRCLIVAAVTTVAGVLVALTIPMVPDTMLYSKNKDGTVIKSHTVSMAAGAMIGTAILLGTATYITVEK